MTPQQQARNRERVAARKNARRIHEVGIVYAATVLVIQLNATKRKKTKFEKHLIEAVNEYCSLPKVEGEV